MARYRIVAKHGGNSIEMSVCVNGEEITEVWIWRIDDFRFGAVTGGESIKIKREDTTPTFWRFVTNALDNYMKRGDFEWTDEKIAEIAMKFYKEIYPKFQTELEAREIIEGEIKKIKGD